LLRKIRKLALWFLMDILYITLLFSIPQIPRLPIQTFLFTHFIGIGIATVVMFAGLGAGILWFPVFTYLGFSPLEIIPISLFTQIAGLGSGSLKYCIEKMVNMTIVSRFLPCVFIGVSIGYLSGIFIPREYEKWLLFLFFIVVLYLIVLMIKSLREIPVKKNTGVNPAIFSSFKCRMIVIVSSFFTGFLSIGNSDWLIPYMERRLKIPISRAVATGVFIMFCAACFYFLITAGSALLGTRDWPRHLLILQATCSGVIVGGQIGARLVKIKFIKKYQKPVFILMLVLSGLNMIVEFFKY